MGQPWTILWTGAPLRHIHGEYPDYELGCPKCRDAAERDEERARESEERARESERRADERAEELARELAESAEEAAYKQASPGDYECPSCLYITLRKGAVACPKCQRDVPPQYWLDVRTKEEAKAREEARRQAAAAEEWKRTEPQSWLLQPPQQPQPSNGSELSPRDVQPLMQKLRPTKRQDYSSTCTWCGPCRPVSFSAGLRARLLDR